MLVQKIQRAGHACGRRSARSCVAALLAVALSGSFCEDTPQAGKGNLDRPGGVVAFGAGDRTYAVLSLPQIRHLRAFSLTSYVFVPAPNVYFPLSIPVGPFTHRVVVDPAHGLGFALDSADGALRAFRLGVASDTGAFARVGDPIPAGLGPSGVAVDPASVEPRLYVSSALSGEVLEIVTTGAVDDFEIVRVMPAGQKPADVALEPTSRTLVVADAAADAVSLIDLESGDRREVDVGGPSARVVIAETALATATAGAQLALVLRHDAPEIAILEPAAAVPLLAIAEIPDLPVDLTVLSSELHGAEVCAGIDDSGRCEYAAVLTVSGRVYYLDLTTRSADDLPQPQIFDSEEALPAAAGEPNSDEDAYDPNSEDPDAALRRPHVEVAAITDFGTPPTVRQSENVSYVFTYQGIVAPIRSRRGRLDLTQNLFIDNATDIDLAGMGAAPGDLLDVPAQDGCPDALRLPIADVDGARLDVAGATTWLDCLGQSAGVIYSVRAGGQFTAAYALEADAPGILGRASFGVPYQGHTVEVTLTEATGVDGSALGPPDTGAALVIRIEDNFAPRQLALGQLSSLPTGITAARTSDQEPGWRLLISAAGGSSLFIVEPGTQGLTGTDYLPPGVLRFE